MAVRYFAASHSMFPEPVGVFRQLLDKPGVPLPFERLGHVNGEWVEDDALPRHLRRREQ